MRSKALFARIGVTPFEGNVKINSGDTMNLVVTVIDDAGAAVNITGYSATWKLAVRNDASADVSKAVGSGITLTTPASGILTIALTAADTADRCGAYVHELQLTDGSGNVSTALCGRLTIAGDLE